MRLDFAKMEEIAIPQMNGGAGEVVSRMVVNECGRFVLCHIPAGASIGTHRQVDHDDINYVISGMGTAYCDGVPEPLSAGVCHICPAGSEHSIVNDGEEDLVLFTVVK